MKPIRVLSIDFDYFVKATAEQRVTIFPDGLDQYGVAVNNAVWMSRYADCAEIEEIGIVEDDYSSMVNYLNLLSRKPQSMGNIRMMTTNSHQHLYNLMFDDYNDKAFDMLHIDYHSDSYGLKDGVDCGNWVDWIAKKWKKDQPRLYRMSRITWLGREDSEYNCKDIKDDRFFKAVQRNNQPMGDQINDYFHGKMPDVIFICKSGPWTPPHLDDYFDELISIGHMFNMRGVKTLFSNDVENRWTEEYQEALIQHREQMQQLKSGIMKGDEKSV